MNKTQLKSLIKERITNQKNEIIKSRIGVADKEAYKFVKLHGPTKYYNKLDTVAALLEGIDKTISEVFIKPSDISYSYNNGIYNYRNASSIAESSISGVFSSAILNGNMWKNKECFRTVTESAIFPEVEEVADRLQAEYFDNYKLLDTMLIELMSIVTAAKSAKQAYEHLKDLGINFDIPEAKKVESMLPAVVKLTGPVELFNESVGGAK